MKITEIIELEEGSAEVQLELTQEEAQYLMQEGFVTLLKRAIKEEKRKRKIPALLREKENYGGNDD